MPKRTRPQGDLITVTEAARMLGVHPATLRTKESEDRRSVRLYDGTLRVFWTSYPGGERRYSRAEIDALLSRRK